MASYPYQDLNSQYGNPYAHYGAPPGPGVNAGSMMYTSATGQDGRIIYSVFRATPASHQTAYGQIVQGVQWVPMGNFLQLPPGAMPATAVRSYDYRLGLTNHIQEFAASWNREGSLSREEAKRVKQWQKDEEKRLRKEREKALRRQEKERERSGEYSGRNEERRRDKRREETYRDGRSNNQQGSSNYPVVDPSGFPTAGASAYPTASNPGYSASADAPYPTAYPTTGDTAFPSANSGYPVATGPYRSYPGETEQVTQQMGDMGISNGVGGFTTRSRRMNCPSRSEGQFTANPPFPTANAYPTANMGQPVIPNMGESGVYPSNHILAGQPMQSRSRRTSMVGGAPNFPVPGGIQSNPGGFVTPAAGAMPQPVIPRGTGPSSTPYRAAQDVNQQSAPPSFSRPVNGNLQFEPFQHFMITAMNGFLNAPLPQLPAVLVSHDVLVEDWNRLMNDLFAAWSETLPVASERRPKRSRVVGDLVEVWNLSFFRVRGTELTLYKGREARSGPRKGNIDTRIPLYDQDDSTSDSDSTDGSYSDGASESRYGQPSNLYGGMPMPGGHAAQEDARRRLDQRRERKRRGRERRGRRSGESDYTLYLFSIQN